MADSFCSVCRLDNEKDGVFTYTVRYNDGVRTVCHECNKILYEKYVSPKIIEEKELELKDCF